MQLLLSLALFLGYSECAPVQVTTYYEDTSIVTTASDNVLTCIGSDDSADTLQYVEFYSMPDGAVIAHRVTYTSGAPFPESVTHDWAYWYIIYG